MGQGDIVLLVSRLATAAVAAFLAILLWSRTRDIAWMLIVIGAIAGYADLLFELLSRLGLVDESIVSPWGIPLGRVLFSNLPYLFLIAALSVMIIRKRVR
jgi:hypothetical protein